MGARQSVAQTTTDQSTPCSSVDRGLASLSPDDAQSTINEASTSGVGSIRPHVPRPHRNHQIRSRSMLASSSSSPQSDAAALIAALNQHRVNQLLARQADQSSDSGDENGESTNTGNATQSLNRLLRMASLTDGGQSSSSGSRVWIPPFSFRYFEIKCPVCNKSLPFDDMELHLVMCLTRPKIIYNEEELTEDRDECIICFDEMSVGDTIARLPCLCVYHKTCIDSWFKVKNTCPAHPGDD